MRNVEMVGVDEDLPPNGTICAVFNERLNKWQIQEYNYGWQPPEGETKEQPFRPTFYIVLPKNPH